MNNLFVIGHLCELCMCSICMCCVVCSRPCLTVSVSGATLIFEVSFFFSLIQYVPLLS